LIFSTEVIADDYCVPPVPTEPSPPGFLAPVVDPLEVPAVLASFEPAPGPIPSCGDELLPALPPLLLEQAVNDPAIRTQIGTSN